jgi:hypothetical protein
LETVYALKALLLAPDCFNTLAVANTSNACSSRTISVSSLPRSTTLPSSATPCVVPSPPLATSARAASSSPTLMQICRVPSLAWPPGERVGWSWTLSQLQWSQSPAPSRRAQPGADGPWSCLLALQSSSLRPPAGLCCGSEKRTEPGVSQPETRSLLVENERNQSEVRVFIPVNKWLAHTTWQPGATAFENQNYPSHCQEFTFI